jgi:hypothetical protein
MEISPTGWYRNNSGRDSAFCDFCTLQARERLYTRPEKTEKKGFAERPWRGDDTLILRATFRAIETRYVVRDPESPSKVHQAWVMFRDKLTLEQLYG